MNKSIIPQSKDERFEQLKATIKSNDPTPALKYLSEVRNIKLSDSIKKHIFFNEKEKRVEFFDKTETLINYRSIKDPKKGNEKGSKLKNAVFTHALRKEQETVYLTEGVINALSFYSLGYSALSFFSTSNRVDSKDLIIRYLKNKHIILAFDADDAGNKYTMYWLKTITETDLAFKSVSVLNFPDGKDANDLLVNNSLQRHLLCKNFIELKLSGRIITISDIRKIYDPDFNKKGDLIDLNIHYSNLSELFLKMGFQRYDIGMDSMYVQNIDNVLTPVSRLFMQDEFFRLIESLPEMLDEQVSKDMLKEKLYRSPSQYFSDARFSLLRPPKPIEFVKDDKQTAFLFFKNAFVRITKEEVKMLPYSDLKGNIWSKQIIDHEISIDLAGERRAVFEKFLWNVAGKEEKRFFALLSIIGYVSHSFYEGKLKAIILTDSSMSDGADGRSGKTLFAKSLGFCKVYVEINGKDFDPSKQFKFQSLTLDTEIVHLNDVKKSFQFELLFNDITEGISIEKKGKAPIHTNAKIILSTNKTISLEGGSARDRALEFEFSDHYNEKYSPEDEFGHWFFRDWDQKEFNCFYNLFFKCIQLYLKQGLLRAPTINLELRKLIESTNKDFVSFMKEAVETGLITIGKESNKKELHEAFLSDYEEYAQGHKYQHQRNFTVALHKWAEFYPGVSREVKERSSGKNQYILFQKE